QGSTYPSGYSITSDSPPNPVCDGSMNNTCYFQDSTGANLGSITSVGAMSLSNTKGFGSCSSGGSMTWSNGSVCSPNRDNTGFNPASCTQTVGNGTANCGTANATGLTGPASSQMPQFYYSTSD